MGFEKEFKKQLFSTTAKNFTQKAILLFKHQVENNPIYKKYVQHLGKDASIISKIEEIPFLPIQFFKSHEIICNSYDKEYVFHSSGTTGKNTSKHWVTDLKHYQSNTIQIFEHFYGKIKQYTILALLPSYLERSNSSLISMTDLFINKSHAIDSGYYLYNHEELFQKLKALKQDKTPTILIGVTFALLDFIDQYSLDFNELIIMETGGMKGRKKELTRPEVHKAIQLKFPSSKIHSEYGMTELFSQLYSKENNEFKSAPWTRASVRDITDPFNLKPKNSQGILRMIDLANVDSCAFIETEDLAKVLPNGNVEILGRADNTLQRGCNLLVQ